MGPSEVLERNVFPDAPLDSKDRSLIQTVYREGEKGIGFNGLVEKARGFASKSTVALRVKRLVRLGYLERNPGTARGKQKPVRVTFKCYTMMISIDKTGEIATRLRSQIRAMEGAKVLDEAEVKRYWRELRERYNTFFGMVGTMAVFYGTSAAGDLFLPLIVDEYKRVSSEFMEMLRARPELVGSIRKIVDEQAAARGIDLEEVRRNAREEVLGSALYRFRSWDDAAPRSR